MSPSISSGLLNAKPRRAAWRELLDFLRRQLDG
jgi:hypothetical protein